MKRVSLLTVALLFATTVAYTHYGHREMDKGKSTEDIVKMKMEKMTERLNLTDEQVAQIEPLVKEKIEKKKAVMEEARTKKQAISEEYKTKVQALLDEEQQQKLDEWKKEKEEMKGKGYGYGRKHKMMY